jgi:bacterioferritin-associated ferredoxin
LLKSAPLGPPADALPLERPIAKRHLLTESRFIQQIQVREEDVPPRSGLAEAWQLERLDDFDSSPTICICFSVKSQAILSAIKDGACSTERIGVELGVRFVQSQNRRCRAAPGSMPAQSADRACLNSGE